jgi:hypothetical protein
LALLRVKGVTDRTSLSPSTGVAGRLGEAEVSQMVRPC